MVNGENNSTLVGLMEIPLDQIRPFPSQPRTDFDEDELFGLSESIGEIGLQSAISVRTIFDADNHYRFELIDGERRYRACQMARKEKISALVWNVVSEDDQFIKSVAANFCRAPHTPIETACALDRIVKQYLAAGLKKELAIDKAAKICGRSAAWVQQHLILLNLCQEVREKLTSKELFFQVGIALSNLKPEYQISFASHIVKSGLGLRRALHYIRDNCDHETLSANGRKRRPSRDYNRFQRFLENLEQETDIILDMKFSAFEAMLTQRSYEDLQEVVELLEDSIDNLKGLAENVKKVILKKVS